MSRIPDHILEDILGRVDIVELVSTSVPLKKAGRNFKACCPFHHEKTASFVVSPDKQIYHCFGCGESGNAFKFLMRQERMEFREAVGELAQKTGVALPRESVRGAAEGQSAAVIHGINEQAGAYYAQILNSPRGACARQYLTKRGIAHQTAELCGLGFAPDLWDGLIQHLRAKGHSLGLLEKAGLIISREGGGYYDRFRDRIIFPIFDARSRVIGFGARVLDGSVPKYINSPETPVYSKGRHLYGLNFAGNGIRDGDCAVVVEGYLDFVIPFQAGFTNIVASLGTALTPEQPRLLKRFTRNVVVVYDADAAGETAALRSLDIFLEEEMNVRIASLPAGYDPDSFVQTHGVDAFRALVAGAQDIFTYKLGVLKSRWNLKDPHQKIQIVSAMLETISRIKNEVLKSEYLRMLADNLDVREDALAHEARKLICAGARQAAAAQPLGVSQDRVRVSARQGGVSGNISRISATESLLIKLMLEDAQCIARVREHLEPEDFQDGRMTRIMSVLFEFCDSGRRIDPSSLVSHFDEEEIEHILCESVCQPDILREDQRPQALDDCIRRLKTQRLQMKRQRLHEEIKSAQSTGDEGLIRRLMEEFHALCKIK